MREIKIPTPHIGARAGEIADTVLLPGDPLRAKVIAEQYLENPVLFNEVRNMFGYTGTYKGKRISVMGTGMGCPSMAIYSYELIHGYGVKNLIRVGTAGALQPEVKIRDVVIGMGSCSTSSIVSEFHLPGDFAPIADFNLLRRAVEICEARGMKYHVGNLLCTELLYKPDYPQRDLSWSDMGVLAAEMESAALYANAAAGRAHALCLVTISDSRFDEYKTTAEERQNSFTQMMDIAMDLAAEVSESD